MRLIIVGNGFDIDHELPTSFCDFKTFLEQSYVPTLNREFPCFPNVGLGHKGEIAIDPNASGSILYCLISQIDEDSTWSNFENELGQLEYQTELDLLEEDEENLFHYYDDLEVLVNDLEMCLCYSISDIFKEWIDSIDTSNVQKKYLFKNDDIFLTFNYTKLLEDIYKIKKDNICHIHIANDNYIVGHDKFRNFETYDEAISFQLKQIHEKLRKDTNKIFKNNSVFFERIYNSKINEIVFFGFSFNTMDCYYIKELFNHLDMKQIDIYLSEFEFNNEYDKKVNLLKSCGWKGNMLKKFK